MHLCAALHHSNVDAADSCEGQHLMPPHPKMSLCFLLCWGRLYDYFTMCQLEWAIFGGTKGKLALYSDQNLCAGKKTLVASSEQMFHHLPFTNPLDLCECQQYYPSTLVPDPFRRPGHCSSQISKCLRFTPPLKCQSTEEKHGGQSMVWGGKYQARPWGSNSKCQTEIIPPWHARRAKCWWACLKRSHHLGYSKCQPSTECFIHKKKKKTHTFRTICAVGGLLLF